MIFARIAITLLVLLLCVGHLTANPNFLCEFTSHPDPRKRASYKRMAEKFYEGSEGVIWENIKFALGVILVVAALVLTWTV